MQSLVPLVQIQVLIGTVCALFILYLQIRAYRRHKKTFFITLANSTIFALASTFLASSSYFISLPEDLTLMLYRLSVPLAVLATVLATCGSFQFFRAYDDK